MTVITIYHNPNCGTSRNVLAMFRDAGHAPKVIEYLKTPPSRPQLEKLIKMLRMPVRDMMRRKGSPFEELDLDNPKWSDQQLIDFIIEHPILINRPIVVVDDRAWLCRPSEAAAEILADIED